MSFDAYCEYVKLGHSLNMHACLSSGAKVQCTSLQASTVGPGADVQARLSIDCSSMRQLPKYK